MSKFISLVEQIILPSFFKNNESQPVYYWIPYVFNNVASIVANEGQYILSAIGSGSASVFIRDLNTNDILGSFNVSALEQDEKYFLDLARIGASGLSIQVTVTSNGAGNLSYISSYQYDSENNEIIINLNSALYSQPENPNGSIYLDLINTVTSERIYFTTISDVDTQVIISIGPSESDRNFSLEINERDINTNDIIRLIEQTNVFISGSGGSSGPQDFIDTFEITYNELTKQLEASWSLLPEVQLDSLNMDVDFYLSPYKFNNAKVFSVDLLNESSPYILDMSTPINDVSELDFVATLNAISGSSIDSEYRYTPTGLYGIRTTPIVFNVLADKLIFTTTNGLIDSPYLDSSDPLYDPNAYLESELFIDGISQGTMDGNSTIPIFRKESSPTSVNRITKIKKSDDPEVELGQITCALVVPAIGSSPLENNISVNRIGANTTNDLIDYDLTISNYNFIDKDFIIIKCYDRFDLMEDGVELLVTNNQLVSNVNKIYIYKINSTDITNQSKTLRIQVAPHTSYGDNNPLVEVFVWNDPQEIDDILTSEPRIANINDLLEISVNSANLILKGSNYTSHRYSLPIENAHLELDTGSITVTPVRFDWSESLDKHYTIEGYNINDVESYGLYQTYQQDPTWIYDIEFTDPKWLINSKEDFSDTIEFNYNNNLVGWDYSSYYKQFADGVHPFNWNGDIEISGTYYPARTTFATSGTNGNIKFRTFLKPSGTDTVTLKLLKQLTRDTFYKDGEQQFGYDRGMVSLSELTQSINIEGLIPEEPTPIKEATINRQLEFTNVSYWKEARINLNFEFDETLEENEELLEPPYGWDGSPFPFNSGYDYDSKDSWETDRLVVQYKELPSGTTNIMDAFSPNSIGYGNWDVSFTTWVNNETSTKGQDYSWHNQPREIGIRRFYNSISGFNSIAFGGNPTNASVFGFPTGFIQFRLALANSWGYARNLSRVKARSEWMYLEPGQNVWGMTIGNRQPYTSPMPSPIDYIDPSELILTWDDENAILTATLPAHTGQLSAKMDIYTPDLNNQIVSGQDVMDEVTNGTPIQVTMPHPIGRIFNVTITLQNPDGSETIFTSSINPKAILAISTAVDGTAAIQWHNIDTVSKIGAYAFPSYVVIQWTDGTTPGFAVLSATAFGGKNITLPTGDYDFAIRSGAKNPDTTTYASLSDFLLGPIQAKVESVSITGSTDEGNGLHTDGSIGVGSGATGPASGGSNPTNGPGYSGSSGSNFSIYKNSMSFDPSTGLLTINYAVDNPSAVQSINVNLKKKSDNTLIGTMDIWTGNEATPGYTDLTKDVDLLTPEDYLQDIVVEIEAVNSNNDTVTVPIGAFWAGAIVMVDASTPQRASLAWSGINTEDPISGETPNCIVITYGPKVNDLNPGGLGPQGKIFINSYLPNGAYDLSFDDMTGVENGFAAYFGMAAGYDNGTEVVEGPTQWASPPVWIYNVPYQGVARPSFSEDVSSLLGQIGSGVTAVGGSAINWLSNAGNSIIENIKVVSFGSGLDSISNNGAPLDPNMGKGLLIANNGASLFPSTSNQLIANNGAGLISNNGAGLIANNGAGLIANNGASLIANNGAGLIANNGAG